MVTDGVGHRFAESLGRDHHQGDRHPTSALEEAWTHGPSHCDLVKRRVYQLLGRALCVTALFLWGGIATLALDGGHQRSLGMALTCTGVVLALACWTVFLCTTTQRSRTFLAAVVPGCCSYDDARLPESTADVVANKLL